MTAIWCRVRALPGWVFPLAAGLVLLLLPLAGLDFVASRQVQLVCVLALLVSGLNLSLGYAGELALGQAAMFAAGAYTAGILSVAGHTDIVLQLVAGGIVALAVGVVTGIPGLRLGHWSLALTSFFLVLLVPDVIAAFGEFTGGRSGLSGIAEATLFGEVLEPEALYIVIAGVTVLWFGVLRNLVTSRHGLAFRVLKQSPVLASSMGISVFRMKLLAYALGALPAGLAGVLFTNLDLYISPEAFGFTLATSVLAASILGGSTSVYGAFVGAAIMQLGPNQSTEFQQYALLVYGAFLVVGGVLLSGGLARFYWLLVARLDRAAGFSRAAKPSGGQAAELPALPALPGLPLEVAGVRKAFGGNQALAGVSLRASPGKVTALIGPNGSGKTTLLNMVSGFYRADSGHIRIGERQVQRLAPHRVARAGVARTFQTPNIPEGLTVLEVVISGRYAGHRSSMLSAVVRSPRFRRVRAADVAEAERALALVGMGHLRDTEAVSLPLGMRRLLEVAKVLVSAPGVVLLDEVASGLDEDEVRRLAELIRRISDAGAAVVLVEHNFRLVLDLADEVVVLAQGEVIASGPPEAIENDERVLSEYLGVTVAEEGQRG